MVKGKKLDNRKIVAAARKMMAKNPKITKSKMAPKLGISDSYLCRLLKKYPAEDNQEKIETKSPEETKQEKSQKVNSGTLLGELIEEYKKHGAYEEEEKVRIFVMNKNVDSFLSAIALGIEVNIPAGLKGDKREIAIRNNTFDNLKIVEV